MSVATPRPPDTLATCLARLAVSAPLAQGCIDAGLRHAAALPDPANLAPTPGVLLASLRVEFAWVLTERSSLGGEIGIGLPGLPLNAAVASLHARVLDSACRVSFEVQQAPVFPATSPQGDNHG